jgi:hypothetical protein
MLVVTIAIGCLYVCMRNFIGYPQQRTPNEINERLATIYENEEV